MSQQAPFLVRQLASPEDPSREVSPPATVASFHTRERAEADRAGRERVLRRNFNPFTLRLGRLASLTSLDPPVFRDWLLDHGIDPPPDEDWEGWWRRLAHRWPEGLREQVWDRLDKVRFFDVADRGTIRQLYLVVRVGWHWHDEPPYNTDPETRLPLEAFTTRERAERRREELQRSLGPGRDDREVYASPRGASGEVPHFEVIAIDWEGAP